MSLRVLEGETESLFLHISLLHAACHAVSGALSLHSYHDHCLITSPKAMGHLTMD